MKIVMLCQDGDSTNIVYNRLSQDYEIEKVIVEHGVPITTFLKRRIKKLGIKTVIGQVMFKIIVERKLINSSQTRIEEILAKNHLNTSNIYEKEGKRIDVESVNSEETIRILKQINPDLVIVNGTRIILKSVLESINASFINMHDGITPKYRGVHGGYWAVYNDDLENCGVTVHFIDEKIDTGDIIYQGRVALTDKDNAYTISYLQTAVGVELEVKAIKDIENGTVKCITNDLPSSLYSHPTIWEYMKAKKTRNIV